MRSLLIAALAASSMFAAACGDDVKTTPDAPKTPDMAIVDGGVDGPVDGAPDGPPDAPPDAPPDMFDDGIAAVKAATPGTGLALPIQGAIVTYLKPQLGSTTNDPAGFTIQRLQNGPAVFVSVDPATTTPPLAVGDTVSFTVTDIVVVGAQQRVGAISNLTRTAQGADVDALSVDISALTALPIGDFDSRLVDFTGTAGAAPLASGSGFQRVQLHTAGITGDANYQARFPTTVVDGVDVVMGCTIAANNVPVGQFTGAAPGSPLQIQFGVYRETDFTLTGCPVPVVVSATALSSTSVQVTFSRNIRAMSVLADGTQFTFDNALVASAATAGGRTVTVTTGAQVAGTTYTVTVANTVTDLQMSAVGIPNTAMFPAFVTPAVVRINELNANVAMGCDAIELRAISAGSMGGFTLKERTDVVFTFPAAFVVAKNDLIVVHFNAANATCNPGTATQELTSKTAQAAATFTANYDTAFDFWAADTGLTATDNVFTLSDSTNTIIDAVLVTDDLPTGMMGDPTWSAAAASETAAAAVASALQWSPIPTGGFVDETFNANAVLDLNGTGTAISGNSIQRLDDTDDNNVADWNTGATLVQPQTFGANNVGQTDIP